MRIARNGLVLVLLALARVAPAGQQEPPQVLLYIPFDGTPDIAYSAAGHTKTSYMLAAYRPGVRAQGAEFGSERYPCGLVVPCDGLIDCARGSLEFWYMPLWNPADRTQQGGVRTVVTDEKPAGTLGHLWLTLEGGLVHFGFQGQRVTAVSATIHRWRPETWHQVVATWDGERGVQLFLDGERAAEAEARWSLPGSNTLYVGANRCGGQRAGGLFDELRLYARALSPTEVELAFIHNLARKNAPPRPARPAPREGPAPRKQPRLSFHVTFDNMAEAQTSAGDARPSVAQNVLFAPGLLGQALVADTGLDLAYHFDKNLSREEGAITLWARALPDRKNWRGVLLTDEFYASDAQRESPGSIALWLQRDVAPSARFTLWPLRFEEALPRWDERDWHHIAACWQRGEQAIFYVNGREVGRATGAHAAWGPETPKRIHIGSLNGRIPAGALIDDLRFYNAPLTRDEVQKQASNFLLPFLLQLERTLYERGQATEVRARLYNPMAEELDTKVTFLVMSPEGKEAARADVPIEGPPRGWAQARIPVPAQALGAEGLYEVVTSCEGRTACPRAHFLVVAPESREAAGQPEAEPNPKADHVETIDCAKQASQEVFCESGGSRIVTAEPAAYREAAAFPDARFAYKFTVTKLGQPHVAIITYPADRARAAEIIMNSRRYPASRDVATGYFVDAADAAPRRQVDLPIYFWPRERENALVFRTLLPGQPAACAKIVIRSLPERLPPARAEDPAEGGRTFGLHWDDPVVPLKFGAATQQPPEVYESFRRLVDYLRFTGQNLLCYPVVWHTGALYSTEAEDFRLGPAADRHCTDWIEYVLYLCERAGIKFLPEIVFDDSIALAAAFGAHTTETAVAGIPTARMVTWDDTLTRNEPGDPPRYNPLHPAVRAALLERVTEVVSRYGNSPALLGVSVRLGPEQSTWFGSIQCGYDDQTVQEFAKDAGFTLTEGKAGPARFSERARWLLANKYDQWVSFRCRRLRQLYVDLASRLQSKRPDLLLYLSVCLPDSASWHPLLNLTAWANRPLAIGALYREAGLDVSLYEERPLNLVIRRVTYPTDDRFLTYRYGTAGPNPDPGLARDLAFQSEGAAPLIGFPRASAACSYRYFESPIGAIQPPFRFWWQAHPMRASHPTPAGQRFLEPCAHALADLDVSSLTLGGAGPLSAGHESDVRAFARAFRALPAAPFSTLMGLSDPVCARELHRGEGHYFYLVNRASFPVDAYVALSGKQVQLRDFAAAKDISLPHVENEEVPAPLPKDFVSEHTLAEGEGPLPELSTGTHRVTGALLHVQLQPFEMRSYRILTAAALIRYAASSAPVGARARLAQRIESAKGLLAHSRAPADTLAAARTTLDLAIRAWRKHELARVEYLLDSYPLARLR